MYILIAITVRGTWGATAKLRVAMNDPCPWQRAALFEHDPAA
jgi:hypothetical protein